MREAAAAVSISATGAAARAKVVARRLGLVALAGLLGAAAFPLAFPVGPREELLPSGVLEPLAFVCLVPVLFAIRGLGARKSFGWGFFAGMFFFTAVFWWVNVAMTTFGGMPSYLSVPALLMLAAWCAFHWGLAFGVSRQIQKGFGWPMGAILPPVWMASELMRNYFCSGFPWGNLGYTQMRNLWLSQVGSLGGVYGVAFVVALANGAAYELLRWRALGERAFPKRLAVAAASLLVLGHAWGAYRVARYDALAKAAPEVTVAVVQGNIDQRLKNVQGSMPQMVLDAYNPPTAAADAAGADLIAWPEAAFPLAFVTGSTEVPWRGGPRGLGLSMPAYGAHLLLGVDVWDPGDRRHGNENAAYLVSPERQVLSQYTKHHLVPFGEYVLFNLDRYLPIGNLVPGTFKPGTSLAPLDVPLRGRPGWVKVGPEICFDAIFPEISRAYATAGAQLLVNMTNDAWYGFSSASFQFLRMVAMRAVETGLPVARAANTGISAFIDPVGRISDATPIGLVDSKEDRVDARLRVPSERRVRALPLVEGRTPYVVIGDIPAYLASLFSIAALALATARGRAQNRGPNPGAQES